MLQHKFETEGLTLGAGGAMPQLRIENRAPFDSVRYANCWEDANVLCEALQPLKGRRILSIASAGDNTLALAAEGAEVVAADLSPAQLACLELRRAAFRCLDHDGVLRFLGVRPDKDRLSTYDRLERILPPDASAFWRTRREIVARGAIHGGKFERYLRTFRHWILPLVHSRRDVELLFERRNDSDRQNFYDDVWDNLRWRILFRFFFSESVMGRMGRDPEFFRYVDGLVSDRLLSRVRDGLTKVPAHTNPYLDYIVTGNFTRCLPRYLQPDRFDRVREGIDRVSVHLGSVEDVADDHGAAGFDGFNLSDIFEYADLNTCREMYSRLVARARSGARIVYWNMLVQRQHPPELSGRVFARADLAERLFRADQAFFYSALVIEEVL